MYPRDPVVVMPADEFDTAIPTPAAAGAESRLEEPVKSIESVEEEETRFELGDSRPVTLCPYTMAGRESRMPHTTLYMILHKGPAIRKLRNRGS
jgi:hypothetical protein